MVNRRSSLLGSGRGRSSLNRAPSPLLALALPWVTIMLASLVPVLPVIASAPILPPFGFLMLLAWRQIRPGLLPVWAGMPLGMFDDLFSGQPFGSAVLLWSIAMLLFELIETRFPWRSFVLDWLIAGATIAGYLVLGMVIAAKGLGLVGLTAIAPQMALSVLLFPLAGRMVARVDQLRLMPFMEIS